MAWTGPALALASLARRRNAPPSVPLSAPPQTQCGMGTHHVKQEVWARVIPVLGELEDLVGLSSHKLHPHPSVAHVCRRQASGGIG